MLLTGKAAQSELQKALQGNYALLAHNTSGAWITNATLSAAKAQKAPVIVQYSIGAGKFASGQAIANSVDGVIANALALEYTAEKSEVPVLLTTDHCQLSQIDFVNGLLDFVESRVSAGKSRLISGVMFDGSAEKIEVNVAKAKELAARCSELEVMLEIELGQVGGEEDGAASGLGDQMYTTPEQVEYALTELKGNLDWIMWALIFGNKHGVYKAADVELRPDVLLNCQQAARKILGKSDDFKLPLVFHGGSGTATEDVQKTLDMGVVKMNVDTECQLAAGGAIAKYCEQHGVQMQDILTGKKVADPRKWIIKCQEAMHEVNISKIQMLRSDNKVSV